jgi:3-oxoacyl-[acyl-carrier protein] reductase
LNLALDDRVALVTGSSRGIGEATAKSLAAEGAQVIVHGRHEADVERVVEEIRAGGGRAIGQTADLRGGDPQEFVAATERDLGPVEILVNNAGVFPDQGWDEAEPEDWLAVYDGDVVASVRLIRLVLPAMRHAGWGRVIQLSSGLATVPFATMPHYSAAKAAVLNLTVSLAKHLSGTGVTANSVSPGIVATAAVRSFYEPIAAKRGWGSEWPEVEFGVLENVLDNPTRRLGKPDEIASLITYLASPRADWINGANFRIDGGSTVSVN